MNWAQLKGEVPQIPLALVLYWCFVGEGQVRAPCLNYPKVSPASLSSDVLFFSEVKEPACIVLIFISQVSVQRLLPQPLSSPFFCVGVLPVCMSVPQVCSVLWRLEEGIKSTRLELQMVLKCHVDLGS